MSDRITKVMGYAITDLKTKNGEITDPRINLESPFADGNYGRKGIARLTGEDYFNWLKSNYHDSQEKSIHYLGNDYYHMANSDKGTETNLEKSITFASDLGLPKVFMITPVSMQKEWYRHDDAIDFEEYFIAHKRETFDMQAYIKPITSGNIFPYSGWINAKTKQHIKHDDLGIYKYMLSEKVSTERLNIFAQEMGFENKEEVEKYLKPSPPEDLVSFLEFGKLLTSPEYVYDFKPAIYTYWA